MQSVKEYEDAIRSMLAEKGLNETNRANHEALKAKKISMAQFRAGAKILAGEVIRR